MGSVFSSEQRRSPTAAFSCLGIVAGVISYVVWILTRPKHRTLTDAMIRAEVAGLPTLEAKLSFGGGTHNVKTAEHNEAIPVIVSDGRTDVGRFKLDTHGFELVPAPGLGFDDSGQLLDLYDADVHYKEFAPRCAELLLKHMKGATRVIPFDHIVRNPVRLEAEVKAMEEAVKAAEEKTRNEDSSTLPASDDAGKIERAVTAPAGYERGLGTSGSSDATPVGSRLMRQKSMYSTASQSCSMMRLLPKFSRDQFTHALMSTDAGEDDDDEESPVAELPKMTKFLHGALAKVHGDYTERSGPARAKQLLEPFASKKEIKEALTSRFAIVNVWYPFKTVEADPLGFVTWHSALPSMVRTNRLYFAHRVGETYKANFDLRQNWVYFSEVTNQEAIFLKVYDSAHDVSRFTLHSSFRLPEQDRREVAGDPPLPVRESTEVRCLVFFGEGLEDLAPNFIAPHMVSSAAGTEIKGGVLRNASLVFDGGNSW